MKKEKKRNVLGYWDTPAVLQLQKFILYINSYKRNNTYTYTITIVAGTPRRLLYTYTHGRLSPPTNYQRTSSQRRLGSRRVLMRSELWSTPSRQEWCGWS